MPHNFEKHKLIRTVLLPIHFLCLKIQRPPPVNKNVVGIHHSLQSCLNRITEFDFASYVELDCVPKTLTLASTEKKTPSLYFVVKPCGLVLL